METSSSVKTSVRWHHSTKTFFRQCKTEQAIIRNYHQPRCSTIFEKFSLLGEARVPFQLGSVRCIHIVRWQHLSRIKARLFWLAKNVFSPIQMQQATSGTSAATYELMEPHLLMTFNVRGTFFAIANLVNQDQASATLSMRSIKEATFPFSSKN